MVSKLDDFLGLNQAALNLRSQRQQVIASNIANADTPNYKAKDFDFGAALQNALAASGNSAAGTGASGPLATTAARHFANASAIAGSSAGTLADGTPLQYRTPAQGAVDGNTVDMDAERNAFADNGVRYEAGLTLINADIKAMMAALQGGS
ncbi:flagellar basal body rod protein FlgB [Rugamonas sp.]|uniref:flagellar basal body rod protein FlgB n=1 Tax=Rugamonas sp. TaxID=1926287 RepID=UPI0025F296B1|nr:flagellar basal body rod protein FlgB [Rugamonas sp.]